MNTTNGIGILLVEDNPRDAELALRALKKRNLANKLVWVKDGAAALEFIFGSDTNGNRKVCQRPKVILLDLKLPKLDGLEVLRRLKANEETKTIPVVVLTSSREEQDIVRSYKLGVNSYIVKPVNFDNFSEAVSQLGMYWLLLNQRPERPRGLLLTRISVLTGRGAVSLSSFGGEGQGEEVVVLSQHARYIGAATRWNVATNRSIEKVDGPPLPDPLLQRRRGRIPRPLLASARCANAPTPSSAL